MGQPACFLGSTCLSCGRLVAGGDSVICEHCGSRIDGTVRREPGGVVSAIRSNVILYCAKWAETVRFYREVLALDELFSNGWFVEFEIGEAASLSVADAERTTIAAVDGGGITISLEVVDLVSQRLRLTDRGVEVSGLIQRFGSEVFDIRDPEGHRIEFWARNRRESENLA